MGKHIHFDVIIGNPPYQKNDGGGKGTSATPLYNEFVNIAKKLNPSFITMIIPARWYTGGRGLKTFREDMLNDTRMVEIHDFPDSNDCFPDVVIKGGVCYFLWAKNYHGDCKVVTRKKNKIISKKKRPLCISGLDLFIRRNECVPIVEKVRYFKEPTFDKLVSVNDPFGLDTRLENSYKRNVIKSYKTPFNGCVLLYYHGWRHSGPLYINKNVIRRNLNLVNSKKILIPKAWGSGNSNIDKLKPFVVGPNSCNTETYLVILGNFSDNQLSNIILYTETKFFHHLVLIMKTTQNAMRKVYSLVPIQDFTEVWDDNRLYEKYNLTNQEISFIEKNTLRAV